MAFIIDEIVFFDDIKGSLINVITNDEINLPPTASGILLILLENHASPVDRGDIIEKIFLRFGYDLAPNTLSQYISLIRKTLKRTGVENEVIITIPKLGFYISEQVSVTRKTRFIPDAAQEFKLLTDKRRKPMARLISVVSAIILIEIVFILHLLTKGPEQIELKKSGAIGNCDLYLPLNLHQVENYTFVKNAAELANKFLPCIPGSIFILDINKLKFINGSGSIYLARCTGNPESGQLSVCAEVSIRE